MAHNPPANDSHRYRIIDDLAQSPIAMSTLEFFQTRPSQNKALLSMLGTTNLVYSCLVMFDLEKGEHRLPLSMTLYVPIIENNMIIH